MNRKRQWRLVDEWIAKARKHEEAMNDYSDEDQLDEEYFVHKEVAATLHQCIKELLEAGRHPEAEIQF